MKRKKPRNFGGNPLAYFREHFGERKMTRMQLYREDPSLGYSLVRVGQMDEAIPEKRGVTYRGYASPLECFKDKYKDRKITRGQLENEDGGLYSSLRIRGQLDEAIPKGYRGFSSPLECYRGKYGDRKMKRSQLQRVDKGLHSALWKAGQLDKAIPVKQNYTDYGRNPLAYFRKHYVGRKMTRGQLQKEGRGLYNALRNCGQLDKAIPEKRGRDYGGNPLAYFKDKYKDKKITRGQLQEEDSGLCFALRKAGQIDEAIPECMGKTYRGYASPLECFRDKFGKSKMTRVQLLDKDSGLYGSLKNWGQMDEAIPERLTRNFNGNPLAYFREHFGGRKDMTRGKLLGECKGLYSSLKKWGQLDEAIPKGISEKEKLEVMLRRMTE